MSFVVKAPEDLALTNIPPELWAIAWDKLRGERFDAGEIVQFAVVEPDEFSADDGASAEEVLELIEYPAAMYRLLPSKDLAVNSDIILIDAMWYD
jgi:hypothetical protein